MKNFLSCDWGTTAFRLRLIDTSGFSVIAEETNHEGIFSCFTLLNQTANVNEEMRLAFYRNILRKNIALLEQKAGQPLKGIPLVVSGMASSNIGMLPLPYKELPFNVDGSGLQCRHIKQEGDFEHDMLIISGIRSEHDVMRGEETQLVGCAAGDDTDQFQKVFILPGTHSKHISVVNNTAVSFKTYMTGEFFELLSEKSILNASVKRMNGQQTDTSLKSFAMGVAASGESNLLHNCFMVRTNNLFNKLSNKENYNYLSGLLIGSELRDLLHSDPFQIYLCAGSALKPYYDMALHTLGLHSKVHSLSPEWIDQAVIRGQYKIFNKQLKRE